VEQGAVVEAGERVEREVPSVALIERSEGNFDRLWVDRTRESLRHVAERCHEEQSGRVGWAERLVKERQAVGAAPLEGVDHEDDGETRREVGEERSRGREELRALLARIAWAGVERRRRPASLGVLLLPDDGSERGKCLGESRRVRWDERPGFGLGQSRQ